MQIEISGTSYETEVSPIDNADSAHKLDGVYVSLYPEARENGEYHVLTNTDDDEWEWAGAGKIRVHLRNEAVSWIIDGKSDEGMELLVKLADGATDAAWRDAYHIAYVGACNPIAVERTITQHGTALGQDHPAVQAMNGHLAYLRGNGLGPSFEQLKAVEENARRLGIFHETKATLDGD